MGKLSNNSNQKIVVSQADEISMLKQKNLVLDNLTSFQKDVINEFDNVIGEGLSKRNLPVSPNNPAHPQLLTNEVVEQHKNKRRSL